MWLISRPEIWAGPGRVSDVGWANGFPLFRGPARWVRLGTWVDGKAEGPAAQQLAVVEHVVHPAYRPPAHYNDIGLVKLASEPALGPAVRPVCLHTEYAINASKAQACGYGSVEYGRTGRRWWRTWSRMRLRIRRIHSAVRDLQRRSAKATRCAACGCRCCRASSAPSTSGR